MAGFKSRRRHQRGAQAEAAAETFLQSKGLQLIGRNYFCRFGEIDLVMRDQRQLVFIEVRYRRSNHFGGALMSVEKHKQARLIRTARHYLAYQANDVNVASRFDVIAVSAAHFGIQWVKNAFTPSD